MWGVGLVEDRGDGQLAAGQQPIDAQFPAGDVLLDQQGLIRRPSGDAQDLPDPPGCGDRARLVIGSQHALAAAQRHRLDHTGEPHLRRCLLEGTLGGAGRHDPKRRLGHASGRPPASLGGVVGGGQHRVDLRIQDSPHPVGEAPATACRRRSGVGAHDPQGPSPSDAGGEHAALQRRRHPVHQVHRRAGLLAPRRRRWRRSGHGRTGGRERGVHIGQQGLGASTPIDRRSRP